MAQYIGAIDAGGMTFKCAVLDADRNIIAYQRIPTTIPNETFVKCADFFVEQGMAGNPISCLGIACFGPLNLNHESKKFGSIHNTPKAGWSDANPRLWFSKALGIPIAIDTDVNGALLAEKAWGAAQESDTAVYITVGTGIGAGISTNGALLAKPHHPEFGHMPVEKHPIDTDFQGVCSFHGNCLEGMASASSLIKRFGNPEDLPPDHEGWVVIADYMAQACQTLIFTLRPQKIILGGGLMQAAHIIPMIRTRTIERLNHYAGISDEEISSIIVPASLGDKAGLLGGAVIAMSNFIETMPNSGKSIQERV